MGREGGKEQWSSLPCKQTRTSTDYSSSCSHGWFLKSVGRAESSHRARERKRERNQGKFFSFFPPKLVRSSNHPSNAALKSELISSLIRSLEGACRSRWRSQIQIRTNQGKKRPRKATIRHHLIHLVRHGQKPRPRPLLLLLRLRLHLHRRNATPSASPARSRHVLKEEASRTLRAARPSLML